jgi:hypothetical protein
MCTSCSHDRDQHTHYRAGSDCGKPGCGCRQFGRTPGLVGRLLGALARCA